MAHFYGMVRGSRGEASRLGGKNGLTAIAAGHHGAINVRVYHDKETDRDMFRVELTPWRSSGGNGRVIAEGLLDAYEEKA